MMKHYLYMCFLAVMLGSAVSCQQAEELTPTLAKEVIENNITDDGRYWVDVDTDSKTASLEHIYYNDKNETDLVIPSTITYNNATYTVTDLGYGALFLFRTENAKKITSISLPSTLKTIQSSCFVDMKNITKIEIPETVDSIGENAFKNCYSLTNVNIPQTITTIPVLAFFNCSSLKSISLPSGLKRIGRHAFLSAGLNEVNFPSNLDEIGYSAFYGCNSLKTIVLPESLTKLGEYYYGYSGSNTCGYTFAYCKSLTSIVIPSKITTIREGLFSNCTQLQHVTLGAGVKTIEEKVFENCTNLKTLYVCATEPPKLGAQDIFSTTNYSNCTLYVPEGSVDTYKAADYWKNFTNIIGGIPTTPETEELKTTFTDANPTIAEGTYKPGALTYTRTTTYMQEGAYVTVCLPFSIKLAETDCFSEVLLPNDIALYNISSQMLTILLNKADKNNTIITAGHPFLAKLNGNSIELKNYLSTFIRPSSLAEDLKLNMETKFKVYNYNGSGGVLESNDDLDVRFCGSFEEKTGLDATNYRTFMSNGGFAQDTKIGAFRAYIYKESTATKAKVQSLSIATNGVAADILEGNYTIKGNQLIINK